MRPRHHWVLALLEDLLHDLARCAGTSAGFRDAAWYMRRRIGFLTGLYPNRPINLIAWSYELLADDCLGALGVSSDIFLEARYADAIRHGSMSLPLLQESVASTGAGSSSASASASRPLLQSLAELNVEAADAISAYRKADAMLRSVFGASHTSAADVKRKMAVARGLAVSM